MAASFPSAKKTFSAVVNGVTKLVAALYNTPYDEIEAIETFIGAMGRAQAYSDSIKNVLSSYRRGCRCDYKGAADLYVRAGEIAIPDASGNLSYRKNTTDTTVAWADIDTGAEANSTQYYIYAVADASATTFTVKISTNATTPTGCTYYKKIGAFYNDSSGNITNVVNYLDLSDIKIIYDYGTSVSAYTTRTGEALKICYGSTSIGADTYAEITNLPFTSAATYIIMAINDADDTDDLPYPLKTSRVSGSTARIRHTYGGTIPVMWVAIGV